jgi:hypothetical protein
MTTETVRTTLQPPRPEGGWSTDLLDLPRAMVIPAAEGGFVTACGVLREDGSPCSRADLWRNYRPLTLPPPPPDGDLPVLRGKWLWGGLLAYHFGHFLTESTGRLWGLSDHPDVAGVVFIPRRTEAHPMARWQTEFFHLAGWRGEVRVLSEPTQVERLIVPGQGFGLGKIVRGTVPARKFFAGFGADVAAEGGERLYISRSALSLGKGLLIGEQDMENHLAAAGYEIFHPQKHPLSVQIARYKAARQVIAAEGSAIHLFAMVARPHQRFAMVVRRQSSATRLVEDHLRSFGGIDPVTLDALKQTWARPDQPRARLAYGELDLPRLQGMLAEAGFIDARGAVWSGLDEQTVRSRIGRRFQPRAT